MIFEIENREGLAVVTINRPPVNAVNMEFIAELKELAGRLGADLSVRAVLFRSAVPGKFIAGADLSGVLEDNAEEPLAERLLRWNQEWRAAFNALEGIPVPTFAAISGHCFGGGLEFALCCDYRFMVDDGQAKIGLTETSLGIFPAAGGTFRLPRIVGLARAKDMIYRALRLSAADAKAIGLVHEVWAPAEFEQRALAFAQGLAQGPTRAYREAKAAMHAGLEDTALADQMEAEGFVRAALSEDAMEGFTAFWQKRPPQFKGR